MFLVIGTLLLSAGIVLVFNQVIFKRIPKVISYIVLIIAFRVFNTYGYCARNMAWTNNYSYRIYLAEILC